jgi:hypothetical protein
MPSQSSKPFDEPTDPLPGTVHPGWLAPRQPDRARGRTTGHRIGPAAGMEMEGAEDVVTPDPSPEANPGATTTSEPDNPVLDRLPPPPAGGPTRANSYRVGASRSTGEPIPGDEAAQERNESHPSAPDQRGRTSHRVSTGHTPDDYPPDDPATHSAA